MKKCDVSNCPACGVTTEDQKWVGSRIVPSCENSCYDAEGKLAGFDLYWNCKVCGCRWKDGQFAKDSDKAMGITPVKHNYLREPELFMENVTAEFRKAYPCVYKGAILCDGCEERESCDMLQGRKQLREAFEKGAEVFLTNFLDIHKSIRYANGK